MLLFVTDIRTFSYMERVYPVMAALIASAVMNPAARDNRHLCAPGNIEIIVDLILHTGSVHHNRNMHLLSLRLFVYENIDPLLIFLLLNLNMLTVSVAKRDSVVPEVECPFLPESFPVYLPQYLLRNLI